MTSSPTRPHTACCAGASCDFAFEYEVGKSPLMLEIEQRVRGSDYGATSWTTRAQAEATVARLGLDTGRRVLDIGSGAGWPALFLATESGCEVVLSDVPLIGLQLAARRAAHDGVDNRCSLLAADGAALPFADGTFDRVHHSDVLCCMPDKRELLRECHRVGKRGALMEFSVISLTRQSLTDDERELLTLSGPPHPDAGGDYRTLLCDTRWDVLELHDVTQEFSRCIDALLNEFAARRDELVNLLGEDDYAARIERRMSMRSALERGLFRREIYLMRNR